jgi:hypothetical protein
MTIINPDGSACSAESHLLKPLCVFVHGRLFVSDTSSAPNITRTNTTIPDWEVLGASTTFGLGALVGVGVVLGTGVPRWGNSCQENNISNKRISLTEPNP